MPGFVAHTLRITVRKGEGEVITGGVILKPAEGPSAFKRLGEIGARIITISHINGEAGAVLRITRRSTDLGALACGLITSGFHIEENPLLKRMGAIAAQQAQIHTIGSSRLL